MPQDWKRVIKKTRQEEDEERVRRDSIKRERVSEERRRREGVVDSQ